MKHFCIFIILIVSLSSCFKKLAQSSIADRKDQFVMIKKTFGDDIINQLKATKTVFFYKKDKASKNDSLETAISSAWNLTPIIFEDISNFQKYASDPQYSYFSIEGVNTETSSSSGSYSNTHYYLTLRLFKEVDKKGEIKTLGLCRVELYPNYNTIKIGATGGKSATVINKLYDKGIFYNWTPILLKAQLAAAETNLKSNIRPGLFEDITDGNLTQILSKETLYVPKNLLMSINALSGKEQNDKEDVLSGYRYKYKVCDESEFYTIFEKEKRGRLIFEYVRSSTDKFVTIYDLKNKKIIYKKYTPVSYNLKRKDLERIE